ncbi:histidine phosphatase family protein [Sedimenticola sp.]|uniref:histidine phosphatase family protein n=1 Tax=Sedimenticola sp. TaxID=1940285 RepID=UPI00258D1AE3|nr:alpha-ribazole phosphatase family protein [Sedimenticola sp.]MCW8902995.1 alpha-ribazole phosphatase family protein [Sedimenticola sp.]
MSLNDSAASHAITTIDLIRHGEPKGGLLFRGWRDDPLSILGWQQMRNATAGYFGWDAIVTSPLTRCAQFAEELSSKGGIPMETDERLKEIGFGEWEGRSPEILYQESPQLLSDFWNNPVEYPPPGSETMAGFQSRVESAWQDIQLAHAGQHLLVVAHGGVNRMIISTVLNIPLSHLFRLELPYAGISRIRIEQGCPRLVFHCGSLS